MQNESSNNDNNNNKEKFGWDTNSWINYINQTNEESSIDKIREMYEEFLSVFPTAVKYWQNYIEIELNNNNFEAVEKLFNRCLLKLPHVDIWECYLNYCRITTKNKENGITELRNAYEYTIKNIKYDYKATNIWKDYLDFLQDSPAPSLDEQNLKATRIREAFEQAIQIPLMNSQEIWDKYLSWLNKQNVSKLANKKYPKHSHCRVIYNERKKLQDNIPKIILPLPPGEGNIETERELVKFWKEIIRYEKRNPQKLQAIQLRENIEFVYKQSILDLLHFPEIWYEYAKYFSDNSMHEEALNIYKTAINYLPDCILIHFSYADYLEQLDKKTEADNIYKSLLKTKDDETLVWIQYMFFQQRVFGIKAARKIFMQAHKQPSCSYHIYVASAMMEFYHNKNPEQARKIYTIAYTKKFGKETEFIIHYLKFLWNLNEVQNTRALFESVLSSLPPEESKMIWNLYLEFEYQCGDAKTISHLEQRKANAFPNEDKNGILALVNRHRYQNLWPCDLATIDSFEISEKEHVLIDAQVKKQEELSVKFPRPDFNQMMPFREQMNIITPQMLGNPSIDYEDGEISENKVDDKLVNLPDPLVDFIAALPPAHSVDIPLPDIDGIIQYIKDANLPQLPDATVALGKRKGDFGGEPVAKKQKLTQDAWRKRQAQLQQKKR